MIDFSTIYKDNFQILFYLAKGIVHDDDVAYDIVSDAFSRAILQPSVFNNNEHLIAHLTIKVRSLSLDHLKHLKVRRMKEKEILEVLETSEVIRAEIEFGVLDIIKKRINQLKPVQRNIIKLYFFHDRSDKEIAAILGLKNQTVRNTKANALHTLKLSLFHNKKITNRGCTPLKATLVET